MTKTTAPSILKTIVLILILFSLSLFKVTSINAQSASGISAIPPRLELTVQPDGINTQVLKVRNESNQKQVITTELQDFIVQDNQGTPIIINDQDQETNRWAASTWIQVSPTTLELKPGETKTLTLTVMPPVDALPGGHYAMVLHSPDSSANFSSTGAAIKTQVGTLVYVTIPGDIKEDALLKKFEAPKFSEFGPIDFNSTIENLSDIHIKPFGSINITNIFGGKVAKLDLNSDSTNIFPYTSRDFKSTLPKKWLFGRYKADLNALYGTTGQLLSSTLYFWVIPWRLIVLALAAITIVIVLIRIIKKKPTKKNSSDEVAELEKELSDLKKKYRDR